MFMSYIGTFSSIVGRKEDVHVHWKLIHELCFCYGLYRENVKSYEPIDI